MTIGTSIGIHEAKCGDICVFFNPQDQVTGHVGFYIQHNEKYVLVYGGNQRDGVNYQWFKRDGKSLRLASIRRIEL